VRQIERLTGINRGVGAKGISWLPTPRPLDMGCLDNGDSEDFSYLGC